MTLVCGHQRKTNHRNFSMDLSQLVRSLKKAKKVTKSLEKQRQVSSKILNERFTI
jgi:hypothetical protein